MSSVVNIASLATQSRMGRKMRSPSHSWHLRYRPYVLQPFMIAPVLPGETLERATFQTRTVSDPIKNPLIGYNNEHYWFYVKLRDLVDISAAEIVGLLTNPAWSNDNIDDTAAHVASYHAGGADAINWTNHCLARVVQTYFRDAADTLTFASGAFTGTTLDGLPQAYHGQRSWLDSVANYDTYAPATDATLTVGGDDSVTGTEIENLMRQHELLKFNNLTDLDLEDWLATFGVRRPREELREPELLRYSKEWTYPANAVDGSGEINSVVSWAKRGSMDKKRFFKEWGFVIGVTVTRPKVYLSNQLGSVSSFMNNYLTWLPAILRDDPSTSLKAFADQAGPLAGLNLTDDDGYWVDMRDLFMYGDQFVNFALSATDAGLVALPTVGMEKRYVPEASMEALFVTADVDKIKEDGICNLHIAASPTTATDNTPGGSGTIQTGGV